MRDELFARNRTWAHRLTEQDPEFFQRLSHQQAPEYLWIGCSDSRVPANDIVGLLPGELFVHRNVANVVVHADLNCLSVIQYAVEVLAVEARDRVRPLRVRRRARGHRRRTARPDRQLAAPRAGRGPTHYAANSTASATLEARVDRLCELNVIEQARNVAFTTVVQDAWRRGQPLSVHGWIYGIDNGLLKDLGVCFTSPSDLIR